MKNRNLILACRTTTDFSYKLDKVADLMNVGRSELMRYALHSFVKECSTDQNLFNSVKNSFI